MLSFDQVRKQADILPRPQDLFSSDLEGKVRLDHAESLLDWMSAYQAISLGWNERARLTGSPGSPPVPHIRHAP